MTFAAPHVRTQATEDAVHRAVSIARRTVERWPNLAVAAIVASAMAVIAPRVFKPEYRSETLLLHREVIQAGTVLGPNYQSDSRRQLGPRLREMLLSRSNLERLIVQHNLYPGVVKSLGMFDAVEQMRLQVGFRIEDGEAFSIAFTGEEPSVVFAVTTALAESMIDQFNRYRLEEVQSTKAFLEAEQKRIASELRSKEEDMARFLARHPEFAQDTAPIGGETTGASVRAAGRRSLAETAAGSATVALDRQARRLRQQLRLPELPPSTGAPTPAQATGTTPEAAEAMRRAENELATARSRLADLQSRFTQQHPDVRAAEAAVQDAQGVAERAKALARAPVAPASPATAVGETTRGDVLDQLRQVEASLLLKRRGSAGPVASSAVDDGSWIVSLETEWAGLNRDLADVRERNQQIQTRLFRASIIAGAESTDRASKMAVIDPAFEPRRPVRLGQRTTGAIAAAVVMVLGLAGTVMRSVLDDRLWNERDVGKLGLGGLVQVIPGSRRGRRRGAHG